jgi:diguanylate cyclase (GGDEF)-like protein
MGSPWSPNIPERESGVEAALAGDAARARAIDAREVEPAFGALADRLAEGALDEREQVAASLAELRRLGRTLVVATPIAFTVGLSLLSGCWLLLGYQRRIRRQALSDALTGLPNRTLLRDRIDQASRQADRERCPAALLLIDLDRFKEVNDTLGHHYGDQLLVQVGEWLRGALRAVDTVARLGGDEFAVLLPTIASAEGAVVVVRKLQDALGGSFVLEGLSLDVEASIGVALYPEHGNDPTSCCSTPTSPCTPPSRPTPGSCCSTPSSTSTAPDGWPCSASCAAPSTASSWCCTTSPRSTPTAAGYWGWRRWCAGSTRSMACSRPASSSPWPNGPG